MEKVGRMEKSSPYELILSLRLAKLSAGHHRSEIVRAMKENWTFDFEK